MKQLIFQRHFKSSWDDINARDFERVLNARGKRDIPTIASRYIHHHIVPDLILYSSAVRTTLTYNGLCDLNPKWEGLKSKSDISLYGIGYYELIDKIVHLDDSLDSVMFIGHNPTMTEIINYLAPVRLDNLPTGAWAQIQFKIEKWKDLKGVGDLICLEYPKMFG